MTRSHPQTVRWFLSKLVVASPASYPKPIDRTIRCQSVVAAGALLGQEPFGKIETLLELRYAPRMLVFHVCHLLNVAILQLHDPTLELLFYSPNLPTGSKFFSPLRSLVTLSRRKNPRSSKRPKASDDGQRKESTMGNSN